MTGPISSSSNFLSQAMSQLSLGGGDKRNGTDAYKKLDEKHERALQHAENAVNHAVKAFGGYQKASGSKNPIEAGVKLATNMDSFTKGTQPLRYPATIASAIYHGIAAQRELNKAIQNDLPGAIANFGTYE